MQYRSRSKRPTREWLRVKERPKVLNTEKKRESRMFRE